MNAKFRGPVKITIGSKSSRKRGIPKAILYFFLITQFISGLDLGFTKLYRDNVRGYLRICILLEACTYNAIVLVNSFIRPPALSFIIPFILMPFLENVLTTIILFRNKKYNIYDFLCNISEFCNFTQNDTYVLYLMSVIHFIIASSKSIFMLMIKVYGHNVEIYFDQLSYLYYFFLNLYYNIVDLVPIAQIVIFYYIYNSMKNLKLMLMSSDQKLSFVLFRYKAIVDTCEEIRPLSNSLVSNNVFSLITQKYAFLYMNVK